MNLSDETSRDSSVRVGQDYEENILFAGHNDVDLSVSSNEEFGQNQDGGNNQDLLAENQRHSHTGCICLTFLHCGFSGVSSNGLPERMHSHIGCICLTYLHCVISCVYLDRLSDGMHCIVTLLALD